MKKWALIALIVVPLLGCIFVLAIVSRHHLQKRKLLAAREEVLPKLRAIMEEMATRKRPVLRGEAIPGDGGHELQALLLELEDQYRQDGPYFRWGVWRLQGSYAEELDQPKVRAACDAARPFLRRMREVIQHESCNPAVDLTRGRIEGHPLRTAYDLVSLGLIDAKAHAASGDRAEALALVADVIRFGQDVCPGDHLGRDLLSQSYFLMAVQKTVSELLYSHEFTPEELGNFLAELLVLERGLPKLQGGVGVIEVVEYLLIVRHANAWESGLDTLQDPMWVHDGFAPPDIEKTPDWWLSFAIQGFDIAGIRESFARDRKNYATKPLRDLRREDREFRDSQTFGSFSPFTPLASRQRERELDILTRLRCLRAAVQVHKYRAEHNGAWPGDLSETGEVPLDPWDGKLLRYRQAKGDRPPFIYSVGYNLHDDGGSGEPPYPLLAMESSLDHIFPLGPWPEENDEEKGPR